MDPIPVDTMMMGGLLASIAASGVMNSVKRNVERKDKRYTCDIMFSDITKSGDRLLLYKLMSDFGRQNNNMKKFQVAYAMMKTSGENVDAYRDTGYIDEYGDPIIERVYDEDGKPYAVNATHSRISFRLPKQGFDVIDKDGEKTSIKPIIQNGDLCGYEFRMSREFGNILYDVIKQCKEHFTDDKERMETFSVAFNGRISSNTTTNIHCPENQVSFWSVMGSAFCVMGYIVSGIAVVGGIICAAIILWPLVAIAGTAALVGLVVGTVICTLVAAAGFIAGWVKWF